MTETKKPERSLPTRIARKLFGACVGLAIAAGLAELAVLLFVGEQPKFPRAVVGADFGLRINIPNASYRHRSADVDVGFEINGQGMRAATDYAYEKPEGTLRIVSLGDSFTIGYEVEFEECFSSIVESRLREAGLDVQLLNAGVSGYSNAEALLYLERELLSYEPDLVMLSYYGNDLHDNVRSGLFAVQDGALVQTSEEYVPLGRLANLLNQSWLLMRVSERSNAFAVAKEGLTKMIKGRMDNRRSAALASSTNEPAAEATATERRDKELLAARILDRLYELCRANDVPLLIHSIPSYRFDPPRLDEEFPFHEFELDRPGLAVVDAKPLLDPHLGSTPLYHFRSQLHWTPFSHRLAGEELARVILEQGLLDAAR